jgi:DNA repair exonuclease SbcCD ATPase subunit
MKILEDRRETLAYLPDAEDLRNLEHSIRENGRHGAIMSDIEEAKSALDRGRAISVILAPLPSDIPAIRGTDRLIELGKSIATASADEVRLQRLKNELGKLPDNIPALRPTNREADLLAGIEDSEREKATASVRLAEAETRMKAAEAEMNTIVDELGHSCPVCGSHVEDGNRFMAVHVHGEAA